MTEIVPELRKLIDIWELEAESGSTLQSRAAYRTCATMLRHIADRKTTRRWPECPSCDDEWAAHVAGLHEEPA